MITARVTTRGIKKKVEAANKKVRKAATAAVWVGALAAQKIARSAIAKGPKTGRIYGKAKNVKKYKKALASALAGKAKWVSKLKGSNSGKKIHRASAPGEAPANVTGNLARLTIAIKPAKGAKVPTAYLRSQADYAKALEYGTRYIKERPFVRPAAAEVRPLVTAEIKRILSQGGT